MSRKQQKKINLTESIDVEMELPVPTVYASGNPSSAPIKIPLKPGQCHEMATLFTSHSEKNADRDYWGLPDGTLLYWVDEHQYIPTWRKGQIMKKCKEFLAESEKHAAEFPW